MTKKNRTQKKVAKLAAGVSTEQAEIEKTVEKEIATAPVKEKKVVPQTSEAAAKVNPELKPKVEAAKEATKDVKKGVLAAIASNKAKKDEKPKKADKTDKAAKTPKADKAPKYAFGISSMEKLGDYCLAQGWDEKHKETVKAFTTGYAIKGQTDKKFIESRIAIYMKIATKRAEKVAAEAKKAKDAKKDAKKEKAEAK